MVFKEEAVHECLRIDPARVHGYLQRGLGSLRRFAAEVTEWVSS
jgi:hypothetical protein